MTAEPPAFGVDGRVALVTGASGLLGRAIALRLARAGAAVLVHYASNRTAADTVVDLIVSGGGRAVAVAADLTSAEAPVDLMRQGEAAFGAIDIVVANAGLMHRGLAVMTGGDTVARLLAVNLASVMALAGQTLRGMMRRRWGRVVVVGSRAGSAGLPGQAAYAASKAGVLGWARSVAGEVGRHGITVNVVAPGAVRNEGPSLYGGDDETAVLGRIGAGRLAEPEEIAAAVHFLVSPEAAYVNGAVLPVDGGARF